MEPSLSFDLDCSWFIPYLRGFNEVAIGFENGTLLLQMEKDTPVSVMDSSGKIILAK